MKAAEGHLRPQKGLCPSRSAHAFNPPTPVAASKYSDIPSNIPPLVPQSALEKGGGILLGLGAALELRLALGWPRAWPGLAWPGLAQPVKLLYFPKVFTVFGSKYPKNLPARFARRIASFS